MSRISKYDIGFTQVSNTVLYNNKLSLKAKGLYTYLFSKPEGWQFHASVMQKELEESAKTIRTIINELVDKGYVKRTQYNEGGKFGGNLYEFIPPCDQIPCTQKSVCGKSGTHNNTNPSTNTKNLNTLPPIPENGFEDWYRVYPRKISKACAKKSYSSALKKVGADILLGAVKVFAQDILNKGTEEKFIPHPSTWLNQERWEDYKPKVKASALPMGIRKVDGYWVDLYTNRKLFSVESNPNPDWTKFDVEARSF